MSTYNGATYIEEQLTSILGQTYQNWRLIIRDDGSTDGTLRLIKDFSKRTSQTVVLVEDNMRLGASRSFGRLMAITEADYVMFCDQDDVWLPTKIETTLRTMICVEGLEHGNVLPVLVHSDLAVVDENLQVLATSFVKYQLLDTSATDVGRLMVQNVVTGCATMINSKLLSLVGDIPDEAVMHDWWIAMVASTFGVIHFVDAPLALYRQHESNTIGARGYSLRALLSRAMKFQSSVETVRRLVIQSQSFVERYALELDSSQQEVLRAFSNLLRLNRCRRMTYLVKYDIRKRGIIRNALFFVTALVLPATGD